MRFSMKNPRSIILFVLAILVVFAVVFAIFKLAGVDLFSPGTSGQEIKVEETEPTAKPAAEPTAEPVAEAEATPESGPVYVADYYSGTALDLTQYAGKAVLINYFTEWCPYCMEEMPDIRLAYDTYDPDSLTIILIHPWDGENADNTASVVSRFGLDGVVTIEDEDHALTGAVGVPGYPTSIFVDQEGYLHYAVASMLDFDTITRLLDEMGVPRRETADTAAGQTFVPVRGAANTRSGATPGN